MANGIRSSLGVLCLLIAFLGAGPATHAGAQSASEVPVYARTNSFGIIASYSPNSSHMLLGISEKRKLWDLGGSYSRRLFGGKHAIWQYDGEFLPIALDGDPLGRAIEHQTSPVTTTTEFDIGPVVSCSPRSVLFSFTDANGVVYSGVVNDFCHGRRWTFGEAISPIGVRWNFLPHRRIQPLLTLHVGYMYSTKAIPTVDAGAFNFTFDGGGGFELYQSRSRSLRVEYRYHHISNHNSADENPGIDNGLIQLSYVFGR